MNESESRVQNSCLSRGTQSGAEETNARLHFMLLLHFNVNFLWHHKTLTIPILKSLRNWQLKPFLDEINAVTTVILYLSLSSPNLFLGFTIFPPFPCREFLCISWVVERLGFFFNVGWDMFLIHVFDDGFIGVEMEWCRFEELFPLRRWQGRLMGF